LYYISGGCARQAKVKPKPGDGPERKVDLLHGFLRQGNGPLSKRSRTSEFAALTDVEVGLVEKLYEDSFAGAALAKSEDES